MLPPKNMNQMLVEARLRNQVEENEIGESGSINFEVDIPTETQHTMTVTSAMSLYPKVPPHNPMVTTSL